MSYQHIGSRVPPKVKAKFDRALSTTGQTKSALLRTALEEFFIKNRTPSQILSAVIASNQRKS